MFEQETLVLAVAVKAGPTLTTATTAGAAAAAAARGATVTTEAEATKGGPGGSLPRTRHVPVGAWCGRR